MRPLPPFQPVDFGLKKLEVTVDLLRLFLAQGLYAQFGFSDVWNERLTSIALSHPDGPFDDPLDAIAVLDIVSIFGIVGDQVPKQFLVRESAWNEVISQSEDGIFRFTQPIPIALELYTGVDQVSFDSGGLLVLELYSTQIFVLQDASGCSLSDYCHDLHLGMAGATLYRTSSNPCWILTRRNGTCFKDVDSHAVSFDELKVTSEETLGPLADAFDKFPDIKHRDVSLFQDDLTKRVFNDYCAIETAILPALAAVDSNRMTVHDFHSIVSDLLDHFPESFRFLYPYYCDHAELALKAVMKNTTAFTLLDARLQNDLDWIINTIDKTLIHSENYDTREQILSSLFLFLPTHAQNHIQVLSRVLPVCPNLVTNVGRVSDRNLIRAAIKTNKSKSRNISNYVADSLLSDWEFMIEIAELDWTTLQDAKPNLLKEDSFLQNAIARFNSSSLRKGETITMRQVVTHIFLNSTCSSLMIERLFPAQSIEEAIQWLRKVDTNDVPILMGKIPSKLIDSEAFWIAFAQTIPLQKVIGTLATPITSDRLFAERLLRLQGELILVCDGSLQKDESLWIDALQNFKIKSNENWSSIFKTELLKEVTKHKPSSNCKFKQLVAQRCGPDFVKMLWPELLDDFDFMHAIVHADGAWWYQHASDRLKVHIPFVDLVLNQDEWFFRCMPDEIQNEMRYSSQKKRLDSGEFTLPF